MTDPPPSTPPADSRSVCLLMGLVGSIAAAGYVLVAFVLAIPSDDHFGAPAATGLCCSFYGLWVGIREGLRARDRRLLRAAALVCIPCVAWIALVILRFREP